MIGSLGDLIFECSDNHILTFQDLSFNKSVSYAEHKILARRSLLEFTGLNAASCSIKMQFDEALGIDPKKQLNTLETMMQDHQAANFILDGQPVGSGYWVIESINETFELLDNNGRPRKITADVNMKEYYETS